MGALFALLLNAEFVLSKFIMGYSILFFATLAVHYHNDYFDFEADHYVKPTAISGGSGVLVENPEWNGLSKNIALTFISLSIALSIAFSLIFSYSIGFVLFVICGNLLAWFYAAPPIKLSYRGLGEFANIAIGLLFPAMGYFVLMGTLNLPLLIFTVPIMFLQMLFTSSVEIPDMEGDSFGGKKTWIVLYGRGFGFRIIAVSALLSTASLLLISLTEVFSPTINFQVLAIISLIPLVFGVLELVKKPFDRESATKFSKYNLASVFTMVILINIYFLYLLKGGSFVI
jgi:1,4-dihydroxy-2-naphthoate polyprenyltransferase